jgi:hypothetical protein
LCGENERFHLFSQLLFSNHTTNNRK